MLTELPEEIQSIVLDALGDSANAFITLCRLRRVCKAFTEPHTTSFSIVARKYVDYAQAMTTMVEVCAYDVIERRIETFVNDHRCVENLTRKNITMSYYWPKQMMIWDFMHGKRTIRLCAASTDLTGFLERTAPRSYVVVSDRAAIRGTELPEADLRLASADIKTLLAVGKRRRRSLDDGKYDAYLQLLRASVREIRNGKFVFDAPDCFGKNWMLSMPSPSTMTRIHNILAPLVQQSLVSVHIAGVPLSGSMLSILLDSLSVQASHVTLDGSVVILDDTFAQACARLVRAWQTRQVVASFQLNDVFDRAARRWLYYSTSAFFAILFKTFDDCELFTDQHACLLDGRLFLACRPIHYTDLDRCWMISRELVTATAETEPLVSKHSRRAHKKSTKSSAPINKHVEQPTHAATPAAAAPAATPAAAPAATPAASPAVVIPAPLLPLQYKTYKNPRREMDRYMMQWYDYTCANCGVVWEKNVLTISRRQTIVSECMTGKRCCSSHEVYARMKNGERFLTRDHMPGVHDAPLTPSVDEILAAETRGLLVGIDPSVPPSAGTNRCYFTVDPARPMCKIPASWTP